MSREIKYYIVAADALPEIFVKVAEAKRMLKTQGKRAAGGRPFPFSQMNDTRVSA